MQNYRTMELYTSFSVNTFKQQACKNQEKKTILQLAPY